MYGDQFGEFSFSPFAVLIPYTQTPKTAALTIKVIHWASRFYRVSPLTNKSSAISYSLSVKSETSQEGTREGAALALVSLFACHSPVISHDIST